MIEQITIDVDKKIDITISSIGNKIIINNQYHGYSVSNIFTVEQAKEFLNMLDKVIKNVEGVA